MATPGAYGTMYKAIYTHENQEIPVIVKYQFCKTIEEVKSLEQEPKIAIRLMNDERMVKIFDNFIEERDPGY
jgi:hypothetical protein